MAAVTRRTFLAYGAGFGCAVLGNQAVGLWAPSTRVGIVGMGSRGRCHLRALQKVGSAHVAALCDKDPHRMAAAISSILAHARKPSCYSDLRELLDRADIDVIAISTQPSERMRLIEAAAKAGKNVVIEQPAATTLTEAMWLHELTNRFSVSIEHIPSDLAWDREWLVGSLSGRFGKVKRVEIQEVRSTSIVADAPPLVDALEVAAQLLSPCMPHRAVSLAATGMGAAWNAATEIELRATGQRNLLAWHVSQRPLPKDMERSITFTVQGEEGSAQTVVESWKNGGAANETPVVWAKALLAANACNRERWQEAARRTVATCGLVEILRQARTRGVGAIRMDGSFLPQRREANS